MSKLFHRKNINSLIYLKYNELRKELESTKADLNVCKNSLNGFKKELRKNDYNPNIPTSFINEECYDVKGQCGINDLDKMGIKTSSSDICTLSQLEAELKQFYEFCKENNLSDEEIANICKPLLPPVKTFNSKFLRYFVVFSFLIVSLYFFSYFETVEWHYSAIGRIFLIKLLPFWNWKQWKGEKCLIKSLDAAQPTQVVAVQDCAFCEYIHKIDVMDAYQPEIIYQKYIKLHKPVILENGLGNWMDGVDFRILLDAIMNDELLSKSFPCKYKSNFYFDSGNLYQSLKNIQDSGSYFVHFQNCEYDAVKAFRKYFKRPKFLAAELLPIQYSWLLVSNNYDIEKYKQIFLNDHVTVVGQFLGKTDILLHPNECSDDCESLKIELANGEVLIFSELWNMEYRPDRNGQNLAVILETH